MFSELKTSTAITVDDGCRVECTVVGDNVECELGDRDHNIMITFVGNSLAEFIARAERAVLLKKQVQASPTPS